MKLTIKFYLVLILFIFLFIAAFFTKDAIQTNLLATSPLATSPLATPPLATPPLAPAKPCAEHCKPRVKNASPFAHSLLAHFRSHISARLQIPNPSSHQIIVFRIDLNNTDLSSITPHEYPREQSPHLEKPKSYQNAN